ncbi:hypothetical protein TWF730_006299 [Orbilia blumenaviensis]|uniref:NB-ARC domain-containing protein n=1 Tax=Orbilia blumenaviensis TaxID=1796055 RepID=A0AAV9VG91_9PEZI
MSSAGSLTVRISNLPLAITKEQFVRATVSKFSEYITGDKPLKCIKSLILPDPNDTGRTQVAILTLNQKLPLLLNDNTDEEIVYISFDANDEPVSVNVDQHFRGLTCLHHVDGEGVVDLIFVTGLAGHAYGSWKASGKTVMWIEDFLIREEFKDRFRVLLYGYNSTLVKSASVAGIAEFGHTFLRVVASNRLKNKNAICDAAAASITNPGYQDVIQNTSAAFFFGVPNSGIRVEEWKYMIESQPNWDFIHDLRPGSKYLNLLHQSFRNRVRERLPGFRIVTIYETRETPTVENIDGTWKRAGKTKLMVPYSSALSNINEADDDILSRDADHSGITKFDSQYDPEYDLLRDKIYECIKGTESTDFDETNPTFIDRDETMEQKHFQVPYSRNPGYVERVEMSKELEKLLQKKIGDEQIRIAICALGGAGKTQFLLNFAYRSKLAFNVFWAYGSSSKLFEDGYVQIAAGVGLPTENLEPEAVCLKLKNWLDSEISGNWILLVDAADSFEEAVMATFQTYLPNNRGSVIFTSRNRNIVGKLVHRNHCLYLDSRMALDETLSMFRPGPDTDTSDTDSVIALLEELEFLPLAIAQAAAYMHQTGIQVAEYLHRLRQHEFKLLSQPFDGEMGGPPQQAVMKTWDISYQQIEQQNEAAARLLEVLSLFAYQEIPKLLFDFGGDHPLSKIRIEDEFDFDQAISSLLSFNLVYGFESTNQQFALRLHRLVSLRTRNHIGDRLDTKAIALDILLNRVDRSSFREWEEYGLVAQVRALLDNTARNSILDEQLFQLKFQYSAYLRWRGKPESAVPFLRECIEYRTTHSSEDDLITVQYIDALAWCLYKMHRYEEAREYFQRALSKPIFFFDEVPRLHIQLLHGMGLICHDEKNYAGAIELFQQALTVSEIKCVDFADRKTTELPLMSRIAFSYSLLRQFDKSMEFCERVIFVLNSQLNRAATDFLNAATNVARVYYQNERYGEALEWFHKSLDMLKIYFGNDHPGIYPALQGICISLEKLGKCDEAINLLEGFVKGVGRELSPTVIEWLDSNFLLGLLYGRQDRYTEAIEQFRYILNTTQITFPAGHQWTNRAAEYMAICMYKSSGEIVFGPRGIPENLRELVTNKVGPKIDRLKAKQAAVDLTDQPFELVEEPLDLVGQPPQSGSKKHGRLKRWWMGRKFVYKNSDHH